MIRLLVQEDGGERMMVFPTSQQIGTTVKHATGKIERTYVKVRQRMATVTFVKTEINVVIVKKVMTTGVFRDRVEGHW